MVDLPPLPENLRQFFWDYPTTALSLATDQSLIIRRILTSGTWDAILWLRAQVGDRTIKKWIVAHQGRGLSPRQLRFWGLIYDLPVRQVDEWVQTAAASPWGKR